MIRKIIDDARARFGPEALNVCFTLHAAGHDAVIVGGPVRDALLGEESMDVDIATSATPDEVRRIFGRVFTRGRGEAHGTVNVVGPSGRAYEVTTFRQDVETDGRHAAVRFTRDLVEDLGRRDFTINAIALRPGRDGSAEIVDPFDGVGDLRHNRLRAVGDPEKRFREDHLRILRAYRFAARFGLEIDGPTRAGMVAAMAGLERISAERIRDELTKLGEQGRSAEAVLAVLLAMQQDGVFAIILPELEATVGVTQNEHHAFDVWRHTAEAAAKVAERSVGYRLFVAALLHDIGKPGMRKVDEGGKVRFKGHERLSAELADGILRRLRFSNADREWIVEAVAQHMRLMHIERTVLEGDAAAGRRALRNVMKDLQHITIEDLLALRIADKAATGIAEKALKSEFIGRVRELLTEIEAEATALRVRDLAVSGRDVMEILGVQPGPVVGATLKGLLEAVVEGIVPNTREALLERLADIAPGPGATSAGEDIRQVRKARRGR